MKNGLNTDFVSFAILAWVTLVACGDSHSVTQPSSEQPSSEQPSSEQPSLSASNTFETGKTPVRELHVATTGNDGTGDGSAGNPFRTIQRAWQEAGPGSALRIHAGAYAGGISLTDRSGTAEAPIWVGGAPGEAKPVISGGSEGLHLTRVRYVVVHDLEVRDTSDNGINADDGGAYAETEATRHLVFRNLDLHNVGKDGNQNCLKLSGVNEYAVLDSKFARCGGGNYGCAVDQVGCHRGRIEGNSFTDLSAIAVQAKGGSEDIEIRANRMVNAGARAVNIGGSTGSQFFRPPLIHMTTHFEARNIRVIANFIQGGETPVAFVGAVDCLMANNTVVDPAKWLLRILQETTTLGSYTFSPSGNNLVVNNIFYFEHASLSTESINIGRNTAPNTFQFSNNLWYAHDEPNQSLPVLPVVETAGLSGQDPLFTNLVGGDFHLSSASWAGRGVWLDGLGRDFGGKDFNNPPSIGAYEK